MAKTNWKDGDTIDAVGLNQTGSPIQVSNSTLKDGDSTELPSGQLIIDNNGGLYVSSGDKLSLVAVLKGKDGAKGDKGDTGATGPAGKGGAQGAKGETGATGPAGKDGAQGPKGDPGEKGATGAAGVKGADGKSIKAGVINQDKNGAVTGGTLTFTDNTTVPLTINKATE